MSRFGRKDQPAPQTRLRCVDVVQAYGAVLERESRGIGGSISDEKLPFYKAIIKASLREVASLEEVSEEYLAALEVAYCSLADFQREGGGISVFSGPRMHRAATLDKEELADLAHLIVESSDQERAMADTILQEYMILMQEWHDFRSKGSRANA